MKLAPAAWHKAIVLHWPSMLPALQKVPFSRGHAVTYVNSHDLAGAQFHGENVAMLHFKFTAEFAQKVDTEIARGEHYRGASEYLLYKKNLLRDGEVRIYDGDRSLRFTGVKDLINCGIIRDIQGFVASSA